MNSRIFNKKKLGGFTLIEVLLALGIMLIGFSMVAIFLPAGVYYQKKTEDQIKARITAENARALAEGHRLYMGELELSYILPEVRDGAYQDEGSQGTAISLLGRYKSSLRARTSYSGFGTPYYDAIDFDPADNNFCDAEYAFQKVYKQNTAYGRLGFNATIPKGWHFLPKEKQLRYSDVDGDGITFTGSQNMHPDPSLPTRWSYISTIGSIYPTVDARNRRDWDETHFPFGRIHPSHMRAGTDYWFTDSVAVYPSYLKSITDREYKVVPLFVDANYDVENRNWLFYFPAMRMSAGDYWPERRLDAEFRDKPNYHTRLVPWTPSNTLMTDYRGWPYPFNHTPGTKPSNYNYMAEPGYARSGGVDLMRMSGDPTNSTEKGQYDPVSTPWGEMYAYESVPPMFGLGMCVWNYEESEILVAYGEIFTGKYKDGSDFVYAAKRRDGTTVNITLPDRRMKPGDTFFTFEGGIQFFVQSVRDRPAGTDYRGKTYSANDPTCQILKVYPPLTDTILNAVSKPNADYRNADLPYTLRRGYWCPPPINDPNRKTIVAVSRLYGNSGATESANQ